MKAFVHGFIVTIILSFATVSVRAQQTTATDSRAASAAGQTAAATTGGEKSAASALPASAQGASTTQASKADTSAPAPKVNSMASPDAPKPSLPPGFDPATRIPYYEEIQEDWSSLAVGASKLEPEKPLVAQTDETDSFTRSLVQVKWRPGDPLDLWIILPKNVKNPPVVLYLYNFDQDTDRFMNDRWVARATAGGAAAVGFVSALSGHRFHDRPMKQWFVSELQESLGSTVHDVKFILDYLAERGDVDMNRIGMFGEGSGGAIAILAAAVDPRIKAVDALEPWGDWPEFLASPWITDLDSDHTDFTKPAFLAKVAPLDPVKWLPELKIPVRIQQVLEATATPLEVKEKIAVSVPKQAVVSRFQTMRGLGERESGGRLFDWLKSNLPQTQQAEAGNKLDVAAGKNTVPQGTSPASHQ